MITVNKYKNFLPQINGWVVIVLLKKMRLKRNKQVLFGTSDFHFLFS